MTEKMLSINLMLQKLNIKNTTYKYIHIDVCVHVCSAVIYEEIQRKIS